MPEYKLYYFNARGLGEPIRWILSYAGADWSDIRIPLDEIPAIIPEEVKSKTTYGQIPLLEFQGMFLSQSLTIGRFLARKLYLTGSNEVEAARCDEVVDGVKDFGSVWGPIFNEKDQERKEELLENGKEMSKKFLTVWSNMIEKNGKFVVGNDVTWADFHVAHFVEHMGRTIYKEELVNDFPVLKAHRERIYNLPGIKEYVATRPETGL